MIFQDPFASLHPMYRVGDQLVEAVRVHEDVSKAEARNRVIEVLTAVGIPRPQERFRDYPHQYSGGMRQRAMIAMALLHNPDILIADEPTTALDVTVQAQILELIDRVKKEFNIGVILITHDLGVIADVAQTSWSCTRAARWSSGTTGRLFDHPAPPLRLGAPRVDPDGSRRRARGSWRSRARRLRSSTSPPGCPFHPRCPHRFEPCDKDRPEFMDRGGGPSRGLPPEREDKRRLWDGARGAAVSRWPRERRHVPGDEAGAPGRQRAARPASENLTKYFPITRGILFQREIARVHAVEDVSLRHLPGRDARARRRVRLRQVDDRAPHHEAHRFDLGKDLSSTAATSRGYSRRQMRPLRREMQMIFQDPYSSLNPRQTVGQIIGAPYVDPEAPRRTSVAACRS